MEMGVVAVDSQIREVQIRFLSASTVAQMSSLPSKNHPGGFFNPFTRSFTGVLSQHSLMSRAHLRDTIFPMKVVKVYIF